MKRVFIVHRWGGSPNFDWYPWLKKELENEDFEVFVPEMPDTSEPKIDSWVSHLKNVVSKLDAETYFVGHSIGCQAIMRFLEKEKFNGRIGNVVFVAGWFKLDNLESKEVEEIASPWIKTHINFDKIKRKLSKLTVFLSSNEPYGCVKENEKIFREKLNADVIIEENKGHFTQDDGILAVPEVVEKLEKPPVNNL